ncbi:alpha/beta hydrolase family esterase [Tateyamaria sp. SN6-1]|uniref:alpha/beta hydrolase family esterase n=1 Tax=Tateyamaria sp. SN6-1 TaxID=3092148 RepID=UPI0039F58866
MRYVLALVALIWGLPAAAMGPWQACHLDVPCAVGERSYHVREPDDWDGSTAMPVLIHFHGWQRTGALPVQHQRISGATRRRGVLLIAPNGNRKTWNFWSAETEDVAFAQEVIEDVLKRYPVDRDNIFVSGYSYGSIMAWRVACDRGARLNIRALLGISGTLSQTENCADAPQEVRHVHGLNDNVLDFPFGPDTDTTYPVFLWRDAMNCGAGRDGGKWNQVDFLTFTRTEWTNCDSGRVSLDVHPGGHFIPHGWIARQLDELLGLPVSYP